MSLTYADHLLRVTKEPGVKKEIIKLAQQRNRFPSLCLLALIAGFIGVGLEIVYSAGVMAIIAATALIAQAKVWAWYLSHDCAHNALFKSRRANAWCGEGLSFLNGLSFFSFESYRKDHARHHAEKIDIKGFDTAHFAATHTKAFRLVTIAERCYVPALYYVIKACNGYLAIATGSRREMARALGSFIAYGVVLTVFARVSFMWLVVWHLSSWIRIHVVRFVDCFQHAFEQVDMPAGGMRRDRRYEIQYTFSVPVARRLTFLNLIILNFGFHTAHHCFPTCPWYNLPKLEALLLDGMRAYEAFDDREASHSFLHFVGIYHREHLTRMLSDDEGHPYDANGVFSTQHFTGAYTDKLLG